MLRKHYHMWSGQLEEIKITEMGINMVSASKPFKSSSYISDQKTSKLEKDEVYKHLKAATIEPVM